MPDHYQFDLAALRAIVKESAAKLRVSTKPDYSEDLFTMSLGLSASVKRIFFEKSEFKFAAEPEILKKPVVVFNKHMRIDAMEKYNQTTFFSVVHFYKNIAALQKGDVAGVLIAYVARKSVPEVLRLLRYPYIDYDNDEEVLDGMGALVNIIAGQLKKELVRLGYMDLEISPFKSYVNSVVNGVEYPVSMTEKFEVNFVVEGTKQLVVEMVMAPLPKVVKKP